ncbi:hypothetical protein, partial [Mycobacterium sp. OTB74]|uniref:hypothetical protein n=1 Tax=Mycobacterium sp. OTB74 TaxID=1853452 RepID=UPI002473835C
MRKFELYYLIARQRMAGSAAKNGVERRKTMASTATSMRILDENTLSTVMDNCTARRDRARLDTMGAFSIGPHGHMTGYVKGCPQCREYARTVKREQRMRGRGRAARCTVVPLPTKPGFVDITHLLGTVESATIIECEPYQS